MDSLSNIRPGQVDFIIGQSVKYEYWTSGFNNWTVCQILVLDKWISNHLDLHTFPQSYIWTMVSLNKDGLIQERLVYYAEIERLHTIK